MSSPVKPWIRAKGVLVGLLLLLTGCGPMETGSIAAPENPPGPLSVGRNGGDSQLPEPAAADWYADFGSFVLCSEEPDAAIVLQRVRTESDVAPLGVQILRRRVSPEDVRRTPAAGRAAFEPRFTWVGRPPRFKPPAEHQPRGQWMAGVKGARVEAGCADVGRAQDALARGQVPESAFEELVFVLHVGPDGARLTDAWIDYTAAGKTHTLPLRWVMVACGDRFTDPEQCRPFPSSS